MLPPPRVSFGPQYIMSGRGDFYPKNWKFYAFNLELRIFEGDCIIGGGWFDRLTTGKMAGKTCERVNVRTKKWAKSG
jgi:hypothetical protein